MSEPAAGTAFHAVATRARAAATRLALATRASKDAALEVMAGALLQDVDPILEANATDVAAAGSAGVPDHLIDRLRLDRSRVEAPRSMSSVETCARCSRRTSSCSTTVPPPVAT